MCGIAGIIALDYTPIDPQLLARMNRVIRHRGRDDEGYVLIDQKHGQVFSTCGADSPSSLKNKYPQLSQVPPDFPTNIGFAQRRFSIIDLSVGGHQPFFSQDHTCCVVFNGEIYNYIELRDELAQAGIVCRTTSDTEVLVEAYCLWGAECFQRLNGFWALALYDFRRKQVVFSRDRLGKKPLYWTKRGAVIYFASEIKALLQSPDIARTKQIHADAIYPWLAYGLRDLQYSTFFEGIYTFPAASWAVVAREFPDNIVTFWRVPETRVKESDLSISEASQSLRDILQDAVRIRLRADVPLAIELSGGLDSSALAALAAQIHPETITTYTVRFPGKSWDEEPFARSVAKYYGLEYRVLESPLENFWRQILSFTYLEEEPYHAPNLQTNQVIWTMMRAADTKVSLNGAAGDELFAGYAPYFDAAQFEQWQTGHWRSLLQNELHWSERDESPYAAWSKLPVRFGKRAVRAAIETSPLLKYLMQTVRPRASNNTYIQASVPDASSYFFQTLTERLYSDMTNTKMPYWLRSGDKGNMGIPFEARAPFLDYRLVEFAFRLPIAYLIRDGWHKWILRRALQHDLPKDVLWRKKKMGFPFPFEHFYEKSREIINVMLREAHNPYLDFSQKSRFDHNWFAISFLLWYELFFHDNTALFARLADMAQRTEPLVDYGYYPEFLNSYQESRA